MVFGVSPSKVGWTEDVKGAPAAVAHGIPGVFDALKDKELEQETEGVDIAGLRGCLPPSLFGTHIAESAHDLTFAGPIGLQSEGGEIHFRKVELTPID